MFPELTERNYRALVELLALERGIAARLATLAVQAEASAPAAELLRDLARLARRHAEAVCARFAAAGLSANGGGDGLREAASAGDGLAAVHPAAAALRDAYALLQQGVISWAAIFPLVIHVRDSWVAADAGSSAHLVRQHAQDYMAAAGRVITMLPDVTVEELNAAGLECHCTCAGCSIGFCLDSLGIRNILAEAWTAARPPAAERGVELTLPRGGSAVARSGLRVGDVVVALDGQPLESLGQIQLAIRKHASGDLMEFTVRRGNGEVTIPLVCRREGEDLNEDECVLPAGQPFYLGQAQEARRRLREQRNGHNGHSGGAVGLVGLSAREIQVLKLVVVGATNPIIADELEISRSTVASHLQHILSKLGAANRTEAVQVAVAGGLVASGTR